MVPEPFSRRSQALRRMEERLERLGESVDMLHGALPTWLKAISSEVAGETAQLRRILLAIAADDAANRRRLATARTAPEYELAFTDPEPLVSIVIPTHDRAELLRERSVASALAQSHERLEVIVVGDDSPEEVEEAVDSLGDPRVRFHRVATPYRAREDHRGQWLVRSVMARNEGMRLARGRWLLAFDDDDEMCPHQVAALLTLARSRGAEVAYGLASRHWREGEADLVGVFPPAYGGFAWQSAIYHGALNFFERQLVATDFDLPSDWFMCESMLRAGVRFAMLEETVCRIFPSAAMQAERERVAASEQAHAPADPYALAPEQAPASAQRAAPAAATPAPYVTPWSAPSRFGLPGRLVRRALRRLVRPLEVRVREADEVLTEALTEQQAQLGAIETRLEALAERETTGAG